MEKKNENDFKYQTFRDGSHYQNNEFFSVEENRVSLILYIDDFEVCNPLGTSRKKHSCLLGVGKHSGADTFHIDINLPGNSV